MAVSPERIHNISLFAELDPAGIAVVAGLADELEVDAGAVLASEGDFGHAFFAVEEGSADVLRGDERISGLVAGDVFGEIALLSSGRRTASVVAVTAMRLITLFKRDLWQIEKSYPALAEDLRATVKERLGRSAALSDRG
jgi:voltage-gated potassium channel